MMKILCCFLICNLVNCSIIYAMDHSTENRAADPSLAHQKLPSIENIGSLEWVKHKMGTYPELSWLLDERVQHTQEGKSQQLSHSWSMQLAGSHYPEFERTLLSMKILHLILDGSQEAYHNLSLLQPESDKLSFNSFKKLNELARSVTSNNPQRLKLLEINLLLGDLGKTPIAREKAIRFGITEPDHDLFLDECLNKCPDLFPTFTALSEQEQTEIKEITGLIHFGHLTHIEGSPKILDKIKASNILKENPQGFDFEILTHICDVGAARGHENNQGSIVLTENTFKALNLIKETIQYLATHTTEEALIHYLNHRADWLRLNNVPDQDRFILARLGAMMRLFSQEDGQMLQDAYTHLPESHKVLIREEFHPLTNRNERTPTYIPAVLVNLQSTYAAQGLSKSEAIQKCVLKGLPLIVEILHQYRISKTNLPYNPKTTLNFNKVAGQVRDDLTLLENPNFTITSEGMIELKAIKSK